MRIYGLDISKKGSTTAWVKIDEKGNVMEKNSSISNLIASILADRGKQIAIGIEAPMWIPVPTTRVVKGQVQFSMKARFDIEKEKSSQSSNAKGYEWYQGVASSASMKALAICKLLFNEEFLKNNPMKATKNKDEWGDETPLYVFEGYSAGRFKPKNRYNSKEFSSLGLIKEHEIDAFTIASAFLFEKEQVDALPVAFDEHLSIVCPLHSTTVKQTIKKCQSLSQAQPIVSKHKDIVCLWNMVLNGNVSGPKACDVYGFSFV